MHLWSHDGQDWSVLLLDSKPVRLSTGCPEVLEDLSESHAAEMGPVGILVVPCPSGRWALLAGTETHVRVSGLRVPGIRVLEDRDEIRVCNTGGSLYFSAERLAVVEPYGGPDKALCPRCQEPLHSGAMVVRCPNCGIRHHEYANAEENRKCWTYDVGCAQCGRSTRLDTNYEWQPEEVCR